MKNVLSYGAVMGLTFFAFTAFAATQETANTAYHVQTQQGEEITLPNGTKAMAGIESHATLVEDESGATASQWCSGSGYADANGQPSAAVGYCTIIYDNGDMMWVSYVATESDQPVQWAVLGGTGTYAGTTGGGTSTFVSRRSDGYAWTTKAAGTINTK
jgi:putative aminopeptidase FrvX